MKKNIYILVILAATLALAPIASYAAAKTAPQMTGTIAKVDIHPRTSILSDMPNMTMITFADGRVVNFRGIILGNIFTIGKTYTITYDNDWTFVDVKEIKKK